MHFIWRNIDEIFKDLYTQKRSLFIAIRVDKSFFLYLSLLQKWRTPCVYIYVCVYSTQEYVIVFESTNTSNVIVSSSSLTVKDREEENLIFASFRPIDPSL